MTFSLFKYFGAILDGVEQNGLAAQSSLVESGRYKCHKTVLSGKLYDDKGSPFG